MTTVVYKIFAVLVVVCRQVGVEAERSLDELSVANEKLRVDIEKWTEAKDRELGELMTHWASNNISYHNKVTVC